MLIDEPGGEIRRIMAFPALALDAEQELGRVLEMKCLLSHVLAMRSQEHPGCAGSNQGEVKIKTADILHIASNARNQFA